MGVNLEYFLHCNVNLLTSKISGLSFDTGIRVRRRRQGISKLKPSCTGGRQDEVDHLIRTMSNRINEYLHHFKNDRDQYTQNLRMNF